MLKILFIGDICGKPGRKTVARVLPNLREKKDIDFVIANCENSAGGRGTTRKILRELMSYGVDFFTSGDHVWRQKEFLDDLNDTSLPIIRPANFPDDIPYGRGYEIVDLPGKGSLAVVNLQGWVGMKELVLDPLRKADEIIEEIDGEVDSVVVDFHSETTAEKAILGYYLDGRVASVLGTHTHVATCDTKIMPRGTGFVSDIGMVGPRDASLWVKKEIAIHNYKYPYKKAFDIEESGPFIFNSIIVEVDKMKTVSITRYDIALNSV